MWRSVSGSSLPSCAGMSLLGNPYACCCALLLAALHCGHGPATRFPCADSTGLLPPVLKHPSGRVTRVHKLGTWCTPCGYADNNCHEQFMLQRVVGSVNLTEMVSCQLCSEHRVFRVQVANAGGVCCQQCRWEAGAGLGRAF